MKRKIGHSRVSNLFIRCTGILASAALLVPSNAVSLARQVRPSLAVSPETVAAQEAVKIPADQLDALVAPIALYPDELLSQTLVASTYPLEIMQLQQWLEKN